MMKFADSAAVVPLVVLAAEIGCSAPDTDSVIDWEFLAAFADIAVAAADTADIAAVVAVGIAVDIGTADTEVAAAEP